MAQVYQGRNRLAAASYMYLLLSVLSLLIFIMIFVRIEPAGSMISWLIKTFNIHPLLPFIISFFTFPLIARFCFVKYKLISAGSKGEKQAVKILKSLPKDYIVFKNLRISHAGKESEIDTVVVGETGIFVIEVKNYNGQILGREEDHEWKQIKTGPKGKTYSKMFYNPTKQVGTHVYRLSKKLEEKGIHTWVQGAVFFSNPEAHINAESNKIPVFARPYELENYIMHHRYDTKLDRHTIQRIKDTLITHLQK